MKKRNIQFFMLFWFSIISVNMLAQKTVTGSVSDEFGEKLPGVNIIEKGTDNGAVTDFDGNFSITVESELSVLEFSFIGMETKDVVVGNQESLNVVLKSSAITMDEVVVTALGISREKKSLGYSVSEVDGEELTAVPQENVLNALSGKVSGVNISSTGGPGSSVSMVIRGATSLTSDNQPLFVIDGVPVFNSLNNVGGTGKRVVVDYGNAISDLNPDDIESMSVLKGPSAAALYGSRAGNGVVIITTKSGKQSKGFGVSFNSSTVFDMPYKYLPKHSLMAYGSRPYTPDNRPENGYDYLVINERTAGWVGPELDKGYMAIQWPYTAEELETGIPVAKPLISRGKDNAKNFFQTAITSTNNVSIQDNTEKIDYRLSYTNMTHRGFVPNSDLRRNNISLNSTYRMHEKVSVSSSLNFTKTAADNRPSGNRGANPLQALYNINPHIDVRDMKDYWLPGYEGLKQNAPYTWGDSPERFKHNNPYFIANEVNNGFDRNRIFGNVRADWEIIDNLSLMVRYNYDEVNEVRETKISKGYSKDINGAYGLTNIRHNESNADFLLSYKKNDIDNWNFDVSLGGNMMKQYNSNVTNSTKNGGSGLILPNVFSLSNIAPDNLYYSSYWSKKAINSIYGLASIGYKDIAYLDLTARNDWSSTLPDNNNSYFYPSVSTSILLNNIWDMNENVNLLKIRAGWAQVGNDTSPYRLNPTLGNAGAWGESIQLTSPSSLLNPDLKPEIQTSWEIGTDMAFLSNRLHMDFTYYVAQNENQILGVDLPTSSGYSSKLINAGLLESRGVEATLGGTIITNNNWNWDANFVFSRNRTKVIELSDGIDYIKLWSDAKGGAYTWVGEEIGNIIDRAIVRVEDPNSPYNGWLLLDDEGWEQDNRDKTDENGNRIAPIIGNFNPDFTLGFQTAVSYKNWTLSASFDWRKGGQFVSQTMRYYESDLQTQRWIDKLYKLNNIDNIPQYIKDHADEMLLPGGEFYPLVGGPTAETGGFPLTGDNGITLNDGVFLPGVIGHYDDNGNFVMEQENLGGPGTFYHEFGDNYPWSFTKAATFDADFLKIRDISLTYMIPTDRVKKWGLQHLSFSLFSRNIILWTKAGIGIDPENAFQPETSTQGNGIQFKQGIERYNVNPWAIPIGFKLNLSI